MDTMNTLALIESTDLATTQASLRKIAQFQSIVQQTLKKDHDYGVIPGTPKPTLYLPGAQKVCMLMQVSPEYEYIERTVDFERGFFNYEIRCTLVKNMIIDGVLIKMPVCQGVGSCNNMEKKYRFINVNESEIPEGIDKNTLKKIVKQYGAKTVTKYQIENEDPYTLANTILKMSKKRSLVDATLQLASLAEVFTQDLEDIKEFIQQEHGTTAQATTQAEQAPVSADCSDFVISFGNKHKGETIGAVYASDPNYIRYIADSAKFKNEQVNKAAQTFLTSRAKPVTPVVAQAKSPIAKAKDITEQSMNYEQVPFPDDSDLPFTIN